MEDIIIRVEDINVQLKAIEIVATILNLEVKDAKGKKHKENLIKCAANLLEALILAHLEYNKLLEEGKKKGVVL